MSLERSSRRQLDFTDPIKVRQAARLIAIALVLGPATLAVVAATIVMNGPAEPSPATGHALYMPFVFVAAGLVFLATVIGTRMHALQGTLVERLQKTFTAHVISLALSEAGALLGLVLVIVTRSWDVALPAALGGAGLVTAFIRAEFRFGALVEEKNALER